MVQEFQSVADADAALTNVGPTETGQLALAASSPNLAEDKGAESRTAALQTTGLNTDALDAAASEETGCQSTAVVLDEANGLLVIQEAGALLPSVQSDWTDPLPTQSGLLSEASESWAQEILAAEAESADAKSRDAKSHGGPPRSEDCIERPGDESASLLTVDWIDW